MISTGDMAEAYGRNVMIVKMQTEGLSQEDSLVQLPFRANCMNWVVGHLVNNRYSVLALLKGEKPVGVESLARYSRESQPISGAEEGVLPLAELLALLEEAQEQIAALLAEIAPEQLEAQVAFFGNRSMRLADWLMFFYFHDTYHTGQTEILRQAAGKDDKII
jgi:uncharacterized damage-inducible protein DinB